MPDEDQYSPTIQVCKYKRETLEDLIKSFDFSHVQVGAELLWKQAEEIFGIVKVTFTQNFVTSHTVHSTEFVNSEYPLSSLVRVGKYFKYGIMPKSVYIRNVLAIISKVIDRGFKGYADFKDQLDAVDLGLLPEDLKDTDKEILEKIFIKLDKGE